MFLLVINIDVALTCNVNYRAVAGANLSTHLYHTWHCAGLLHRNPVFHVV